MVVVPVELPGIVVPTSVADVHQEFHSLQQLDASSIVASDVGKLPGSLGPLFGSACLGSGRILACVAEMNIRSKANIRERRTERRISMAILYRVPEILRDKSKKDW